MRGVTEITSSGPIPTHYTDPRLMIWSGDKSAKPEGKSVHHNANPVVADLFYTTDHPGGDMIHLRTRGIVRFSRLGKLYEFEVMASAGELRRR